MLTSTELIEGEQVCGECSDDIGIDFAKLLPCHHYVCFRCLSRLLAKKSSSDALACPSCSEDVAGHTECRKDNDDSDVATVLNHVKHSSPPHMGGDDEAGGGRKVTSSPRRLRRTKSKMRVLKLLNEDEQPLKQIHEDDDHSESTDGKNKRDTADRQADKPSSSKSIRPRDENQGDRGSGDEERSHQSREPGNAPSSGTRPHSSRPNARSLRASSSRRLSSDKPLQSRPQLRDSSDRVDDRKQSRRRSKSLSSSHHGQLRAKSSITNSEHGGDGRSRRRTSSGEDSAHSTASKLSSKSNGDKQQRGSCRGPSRQADPAAKATRDDDSSTSSDPVRLGKVNDDGDLTASESDSNRTKEVNTENPTKPETSDSPDKGRKLVTQMKAIAKLAMLGRGLAQSPRKMKGQRAISLNKDDDDSD